MKILKRISIYLLVTLFSAGGNELNSEASHMGTNLARLSFAEASDPGMMSFSCSSCFNFVHAKEIDFGGSGRWRGNIG